MLFRRLLVVIISVLFFFIFPVLSDAQEKETRYRLKIKTVNPIFHLLFSLFYSENQVLVFKEKKAHEGESYAREFELSSRERILAKLFSRNGESGGFASFGKSNLSGNFNPEQIRILFEIFDFAQLAGNDDSYTTIYKTSRAEYCVEITAEKNALIKTEADEVNAQLFKARIWRYSKYFSKYFADVIFWIGKDENVKGQILKCVIKRTLWPDIILIIETTL